MKNIHSTKFNRPDYYYYHCQSCLDVFICPDWISEANKKSSASIAVCPYCKSIQIDALNAALPLVKF